MRRRNPDVLGDVLLIGIGVGAVYLLSRADWARLATHAVDSAGAMLAQVTGVTSIVQGSRNLSAIATGAVPGPGGRNVCADIAAWRANPPTVGGIAGFLRIPILGFNPADWSQFHDYAVGVLGYDPGSLPPDCFWGPGFVAAGSTPT